MFRGVKLYGLFTCPDCWNCCLRMLAGCAPQCTRCWGIAVSAFLCIAISSLGQPCGSHCNTRVTQAHWKAFQLKSPQLDWRKVVLVLFMRFPQKLSGAADVYFCFVSPKVKTKCVEKHEYFLFKELIVHTFFMYVEFSSWVVRLWLHFCRPKLLSCWTTVGCMVCASVFNVLTCFRVLVLQSQ